jgi:hypothetical protein
MSLARQSHTVRITENKKITAKETSKVSVIAFLRILTESRMNSQKEVLHNLRQFQRDFMKMKNAIALIHTQYLR